MYLPIGAPNVYALQKHDIPASRTTLSDDGLRDGVCGESLAQAQGGNGIKQIPNGNAKGFTAKDGNPEFEENEILDLKVSRSGGIFVTVTRSGLAVWQTKPTVAVAGVVRSTQSVQSYGPNTAILLRPDALVVVLQTALGYLITYSLTVDPKVRVLQTILPDNSRHRRQASADGYGSFRKQVNAAQTPSVGEGDGIREVMVRFRMVIRIDAGISKAMALEEELVVATQKPSAVQCIKWVTENGASSTSTELVSRMPWIGRKETITEMIYDRPMNLATWITGDGRAYAVQRRNGAKVDPENSKSLFQGFCFREPESDEVASTKAAINARFSLIAIGCANGQIDVYVVKDYTGNTPPSHELRLPVGPSTTGKLSCLVFSPDGYCLFAGYEQGWAMWTVYGKLCASTFGADRAHVQRTGEKWLQGIRSAFWAGGGCELVLLPAQDNRLWVVEMARNSTATCCSPANISQGLLHSSSNIMLYKGHEVADVTSLPSDLSLWQTVPVPAHYLVHHWPLKTVVASADGKYVAVAGRRGLAHYSVASGRWRTFEDAQSEQEVAVRGGMCWYQHILIAAVEANGRQELRLYSRESALDATHVQHIEQLSAAVITTSVCGADSLLVYTQDNTLLHYIVVMTGTSARLVQVGQIGFHGIIRAPSRVRAISWIVPEEQLEGGDPSHDVATAAVLFLVDGKLVLLQPSTNELGELKYDMRVIAQHVEYYMLLRDQPTLSASLHGAEAARGLSLDGHLGHSLRDSLWYFDGTAFHVWSDVQEVMARAPAELGRELPHAVAIPLDFAPLSAVVEQGVVSGLEADLVQRRDVAFSFFRLAPRTQLFLPPLLRHHLGEYNSPAALHLSNSYQHLPYFAHALEVLLHDILDAEVDEPPEPPETALLPTALSFLSSFDAYLDVVVNCTRKTELRSWQTLFLHLPPVPQLFQQALASGRLHTAAGYLLVLHALEQDSFRVGEFAQLLRRGASAGEWELCKELARFLVGIDASGATLHAALRAAGIRAEENEGNGPHALAVAPEQQQQQQPYVTRRVHGDGNGIGADDYFSIARRRSLGREHEEDVAFSTPGE